MCYFVSICVWQYIYPHVPYMSQCYHPRLSDFWKETLNWILGESFCFGTHLRLTLPFTYVFIISYMELHVLCRSPWSWWVINIFDFWEFVRSGHQKGEFQVQKTNLLIRKFHHLKHKFVFYNANASIKKQICLKSRSKFAVNKTNNKSTNLFFKTQIKVWKHKCEIQITNLKTQITGLITLTENLV